MKLVITVDAETHAMMDEAAKFHGLPISLWARTVLLKESRTVKHRILCTPKAGSAAAAMYSWNGKPCTKEQLADFEKAEAETLAKYNARNKEVDEMRRY